MASFVIAGRKLGIACYTYVALLSTAGISNGVHIWAQSWWINKSRIATYAAVNVTITTANEFLLRSSTSPFYGGKERLGFWVKDGAITRINHQSMINILMTLFATLIGGPVFFFRTRLSRFLFFVGFGTTNSAICQLVAGFSMEGVALITSSRLIFDFFYNGTIKFALFEFFRKPIIRSNCNALKIGALRYKQDLGTTFIRVSLLNFFGFRG